MRYVISGMMAGVLLAALSGCGVYYPYDPYYDEVVVVEDWESRPLTFEERYLTIHATWEEGYCPSPDVDLELDAPFEGSVIADGASSDRCWHLGETYLGHGRYEEEVVCERPRYGDYEIRVVNLGDCTQDVKLEFAYDDTYEITTWVEWVEVESWEIGLIAFGL